MLEKVIFSNGQGMGYVSDSDNILEFNGLEAIDFGFEAGKLKWGEMTDLFGFFRRQMKYVGAIDKEMIFYNGAGKPSLFGQTHYWQSMIYLSPTKIFSMYSPNAGRDWNLVNGIWK